MAICQNHRFNAGVIAGLNFSELEGSNLTDYYGINAGIIGTAKLSENVQIGMELLFSQNGEYILPTFYPKIDYGDIWLNHIEIPVHLDWLVNIFRKEAYHQYNFNLGIAYTRIFSYSAEDIHKNDVTNLAVYRDKDAWQAQGGITYHFTEKLGLNMKASLPIQQEHLEWTVAARLK